MFLNNLPLNSKLPLLLDQLLSLLKLINPCSKDTKVVFLTQPLAEQSKIMPLLLSDMELLRDKTTTLSETHGEQVGEMQDTSISQLLKEPLVSVASKFIQFGHTLLMPEYINQISSKTNLTLIQIFYFS